MGLFVSIFETEKFKSDELVSVVQKLQEKIPKSFIEYKIIKGDFVRGQGLHEGIDALKGSPASIKIFI